MFTLHCTKKLLDRTKFIVSNDTSHDTRLGNWYATALFWRPQLALFVNEQTLLPVFTPLAPATQLLERFALQLPIVLAAHGISRDAIDYERSAMRDVQHAKTTNRRVLGIMNLFSHHAEGHATRGGVYDLTELSCRLSVTPCSPLYESYTSPERAVRAMLGAGEPPQ
jgi:hypothetical protein